MLHLDEHMALFGQHPPIGMHRLYLTSEDVHQQPLDRKYERS